MDGGLCGDGQGGRTDLDPEGGAEPRSRRGLYRPASAAVFPGAAGSVPIGGGLFGGYEHASGNDLHRRVYLQNQAAGYLQGKDVDFVNKKATDGVLLAHTDGDVPNMYVTLPEQDAFTLGYTIYFFELAIALSGYLNAINPFDQPGVEAYKRNMFALLGKPGFEELSKELNARL